MDLLSGAGKALVHETGADTLREVLSAFSLLGALVVIVSYAAFRELQKLSFTLILNLAVTNALGDINYMLMDSRLVPPGACKVQAMFQSWFALSSVLWTTVICYCIKMSIVNRRSCAHLYRLCVMYYCANLVRLPIFHMYAYGLPCFLAFLPLSLSEYRNSDGWCWILTSNPGDRWGLILRIMTFYVPLWIAILYNLISLCQIQGMVPSFILPGPASTIEHTRIQKTLSRLGLYPLILALCWIWGTANRFQQLINPGHPIYALQVLQVVSRTLQGVLTGIVFVCNPSVRLAYREARSSNNSNCLARALSSLCCSSCTTSRRSRPPQPRLPYLPWRWQHRRASDPTLLAGSMLRKMELSSLFDLSKLQREASEEIKDPEEALGEETKEASEEAEPERYEEEGSAWGKKEEKKSAGEEVLEVKEDDPLGVADDGDLEDGRGKQPRAAGEA